MERSTLAVSRTACRLPYGRAECMAAQLDLFSMPGALHDRAVSPCPEHPMDAPQITDALDRLQTLFTPADDAMVDLSNLVGGHDGPLFNAINALQDALLHDLAQRINSNAGLAAFLAEVCA